MKSGGGPGCPDAKRSPSASLEEQYEAQKRLRVLELADPGLDLVERPAHELQLLVRFRGRLAGGHTLCEEERHALSAEPGRRVERRRLRPHAAHEPRLLCELAAGGGQRFL